MNAPSPLIVNNSTLPHETAQEFFTPAQLRAHWQDHYSISTLNAWRSKGKGPKFIRLGGNKVLYRVSDVKIWEREQEQLTQKPKESKRGNRKRKPTRKSGK